VRLPHRTRLKQTKAKLLSVEFGRRKFGPNFVSAFLLSGHQEHVPLRNQVRVRVSGQIRLAEKKKMDKNFLNQRVDIHKAFFLDTTRQYVVAQGLTKWSHVQRLILKLS
jgi:hypothetical protein